MPWPVEICGTSRPAISNACLTLLARHSDCCRMVFIPHGTGDWCKGPKAGARELRFQSRCEGGGGCAGGLVCEGPKEETQGAAG